MLNTFVFIFLPYAALALAIAVTSYRYFTNRLTWSAYSTQFLEQETLFWGNNPWHYGIILVLAAHLAGLIAPGFMKSLLGDQNILIYLESVGLGLGLLALFGCLLLLLRRAISPLLKRVTFASDWLLLLLLAAQTTTGIYMAIYMRWGARWYLHTAVPYLYSLATFKPQIDYVADLPLIFKLHVAGAFLIVAILPFTKLVHLLSIPVAFIFDPPLLYRWRSKQRTNT